MTDLIVLSLGAGVQSTTLALLAAEGVLPKPDVAIFADTRWEPRKVYEHLARLTPVLAAAGIPVTIVSNGNLRSEAIDPAFTARLPLFVEAPDGKGAAMIKRQCTSHYKIAPIKAEVRRLLGGKVSVIVCRRCEGSGRRISPWSIRRGNPDLGECSVCHGTGKITRIGNPRSGAKAEQWIGFSTDEISRVTTRSAAPYLTNAFPLLDLGMTRRDCRRWLGERGWSVAKSACIGCPFHGNRQWRELRDGDPQEWADAVEFDEGIRGAPGSTLNSQGYVHRSLLPLAQAPIDKIQPKEWRDRQGDLFEDPGNEEYDIAEYGDPVGCSPFGCRSSGV